jgi:hypothetical protein
MRKVEVGVLLVGELAKARRSYDHPSTPHLAQPYGKHDIAEVSSPILSGDGGSSDVLPAIGVKSCNV